MDNGRLIDEFSRVFGAGGRIHVIRAPGRVNLIGEHTDYNDGFVFPMAIEPEVRLVCRVRGDGLVRLASERFSNRVEQFSIQQPVQPLAEKHWSNYPRGVCAMLLAAGLPLCGMDGMYFNNLPVGGGLSSSAALLVSTGLGLLTVSGTDIDRMRLAVLCQQAENRFPRVPSGLMDQMVVATARADCAVMFDCRHRTQQFAPLNGDELRVVVANSMVEHKLDTDEYGLRRQQCEEAARLIGQVQPGVKALRDVTVEQLEEVGAGRLGDVCYRRARHVVSENQRALDGAAALGQRDYEQFGRLMLASHQSLHSDYEVTIPQLDFLVEQAMSVRGVYGARMTGGGFGGCIIALAPPASVPALIEHLGHSYRVTYGLSPSVFATSATAAASVLL